MKNHFEQNSQNICAIAHRGETHRLQSRYFEAIAEFNQAIELNPDYAWGLAHRGETYRQMNCYSQAMADLSRAIELNPDYAWGLAHRGETYRQMNRYSEALADLSRAIELNPDHAWAYACRCLTYEQMNRYEEALADFDRTIALDKTIFSSWRSDRGLGLIYCQRYAEAVEYCEQQLRENRDDPLILYSLAVAKACLQGQKDARTAIDIARATLQSLLEMDVGGAFVYRLGGLAALEGKTDQALQYLQEAVSLKGKPFETARHDPAWFELRADPRFQSLIPTTTEA